MIYNKTKEALEAFALIGEVHLGFGLMKKGNVLTVRVVTSQISEVIKQGFNDYLSETESRSQDTLIFIFKFDEEE